MFENNTARDYIENMLIAPFFRKEARYIGVEFEYPILFLDGSQSSKKLGMEFLTLLVNSGDFEEEKATCSPEIMRVKNHHDDSISYDYSYATIEFSMAKGITIHEIAERFYSYFDMAYEFYESKGCIITGMGSNPLMPKTLEYTISNYTNTLREYISRYTPQKDPRYYLANMQSVQTHIEVPGKRLVEKFNTMCMMDFVKGLLLSNSLPEPSNLPSGISYEEGTLCARDLNWEGSGFPNTGICTQKFNNIEQLIDYFTDKDICFRVDGLEYECFEPVSLSKYFNEQQHPESDLHGFFNVERVTINRYNVIEMRGDCIQPLNSTFCATAFNIGICYNSEKAMATCEKFIADNRLDGLNIKELRKYAVTNRCTELVSPRTISKFLTEMVDIAKHGLLTRGFGEEIYIEVLYERAAKLKCPAEYQLELISEGQDIVDIAKLFAIRE